MAVMVGVWFMVVVVNICLLDLVWSMIMLLFVWPNTNIVFHLLAQ